MKIIFVHEEDNSFYKATDVEGDGNCLFRAIANDDFFADMDHSSLRKKIINNAMKEITKDNKDSTISSLIYKYLNSIHSDHSCSDKSITEYLDRMSICREWGGPLEAMLVSIFYNIDIVTIETRDTGPSFNSSVDTIKIFVKNFIPETTRGQVYILFHRYKKPLEFSRTTFQDPNHYLHLQKLETIEPHYHQVSLSTLKPIILTSKPVVPRKQQEVQLQFNHLSTSISATSSTKKASVAVKKVKTKVPIKAGNNKNKKLQSYSLTFWYGMCETYHNGSYSSLRKFLDHPQSDPLSKGNYSSFQRWYKQYKEGKLIKPMNAVARRDRKCTFQDIETKLIEFIDLHHEICSVTKIGLSYSFLQAKAQEFFDNLSDEEKGGRKFKASNGWLSKVLKQNGLSSHAIHGEGGEMDEKQQQENIKQMQDKIQDLTDKYNIPASQIYNADQTGLFYNKLPNQTYLKKDQAKHARGTKQMKSKD